MAKLDIDARQFASSHIEMTAWKIVRANHAIGRHCGCPDCTSIMAASAPTIGAGSSRWYSVSIDGSWLESLIDGFPLIPYRKPPVDCAARKLTDGDFPNMSQENAADLNAPCKLFSPLKIREIHFRNRIVISPMCQYSAEGGFATPWHRVHLGSLAVGGAGAVFAEATAVLPEGRISPNDLGLWSDDQAEMLAPIFHFIESQGAVPGIQLAHAGRKASTSAPWEGDKVVPASSGGWIPYAPSALAFHEGNPAPHTLDDTGIQRVVDAFQAAAMRAYKVGCKLVEIHAAHGYLLHQFLSPLSNHREDRYGGSFENRTRIVREVAVAIRSVWPEKYPLFLRVSATDWVEGGWQIDDTVALASQVKPLGVDLIDCSSGGAVPHASIPAAPSFQVPFAEQVRREAVILTGAVGLIATAEQAEQILRKEQADLILIARAALRDPHWPMQAAVQLHQPVPVPRQYARAYQGHSVSTEIFSLVETKATNG